jgi:hypothetical protein
MSPNAEYDLGGLSRCLRPLRVTIPHRSATPRYIEPTILDIPSSKNRSTLTSPTGHAEPGYVQWKTLN